MLEHVMLVGVMAVFLKIFFPSVIILATEYNLAFESLDVAGSLGMNDGRFVFILFELDPIQAWNKTKTPSNWFVGKFGNSSPATKQVFQSSLLLSVQSNISTDYNQFVEDLKQKTQESQFYSNVYQNNSKDEVNSIISEEHFKVRT